MSKNYSNFADKIGKKRSLNSKFAHIILFALLIGSAPLTATASSPSKAAVFFHRAGAWVDNFQLSGLDTTYIGLPEFRWRVTLNNGEVGMNSTYTTWVDPVTSVALVSKTTPSVELGFNAGFRGFGGGYSWDLMNAYSSNWNLSFGSKGLGIEFQRTVSTNVTGQFMVDGHIAPTLPRIEKGNMRLANTSLTAWYSLNSAHYSHNAATKQDYIQKKSAGSLIVSVAYMSSEMEILDSLRNLDEGYVLTAVDGVTSTITRQVALGIGYGINYTPNHGKVVLHASAHMQVVCYSVNHVSYQYPDSIYLPGVPQYMLRPAKPVHVTGTMRAGVSWEINRWVHLGAWAQANHLRFKSEAGNLSVLEIGNWNWQAHLTIGVRFGASKKRSREVLGEPEPKPDTIVPEKKSKLPQWLTDYFFSSTH